MIFYEAHSIFPQRAIFRIFYKNTLMKKITKLPFQIGLSFKQKEYSIEYSIFPEYNHKYRRSWAHFSPINTSHNSHFKVEHFFSLNSLYSSCSLNLSLVPQ